MIYFSKIYNRSFNFKIKVLTSKVPNNAYIAPKMTHVPTYVPMSQKMSQCFSMSHSPRRDVPRHLKWDIRWDRLLRGAKKKPCIQFFSYLKEAFLFFRNRYFSKIFSFFKKIKNAVTETSFCRINNRDTALES